MSERDEIDYIIAKAIHGNHPSIEEMMALPRVIRRDLEMAGYQIVRRSSEEQERDRMMPVYAMKEAK